MEIVYYLLCSFCGAWSVGLLLMWLFKNEGKPKK
jgi:hypothetical protein